MTTPRKRKSPNRKNQVPEPGLLSRLFSAAGRAAARHPRLLAGVSSFAVVFGFVAANALWYQPGTHPSPFLATRDPEDPNGIAGYRPARNIPPQDVTTFRIERRGEGSDVVATPQQPAPTRPGETQPAATPVEPPVETVAVPVMRPPEDVSATIEDPVAAAIRASGSTPKPATAAKPAAPRRDVVTEIAASTDLVFQIQRGLSNIAYTDITVDGVAGSQTKAAIRRFEKHYRLPETGQPNEMVLKKLKSIGAL
jgi:hypothetical protein